ncbi:hypothetical protein [Streptomyces sp. NBC_01142]|uniref:hypothetical protein n=1 Tax=Streptomyces sp. NBC_01142 TaxID=2975865 RepID=UPI002B1DC530|nr:hypothetical protein [Streptomyces sp. NBC_01142]
MSEPADVKRRCTGCHRALSLTSFAADQNRRDGLQVRCRDCAAEYGAAYYRRRREAVGNAVHQKADVPPGRTLFRACGEIKPHGQWHPNATASDGLSTRCKACRAAGGRAGGFKRQYGITEAERDQIPVAEGHLLDLSGCSSSTRGSLP